MSQQQTSSAEVSDKVKEFLQSGDFPVLEPSKWFDAIKKFLEQDLKDFNQKQLQRESPPSSQKQKLRVEELVKQIQLDLVNNLTNGTIEDFWLQYQDSLLSSEIDDGSENQNDDDHPHLQSKRKNYYSSLTWSEIEKVAWVNYEKRKKDREEKAAAEANARRQEEKSDESPTEIVAETTSAADIHAAAAKKYAVTQIEAPKSVQQDERSLEHLRNDALRPFRIDYEFAFRKLDDDIFSKTGQHIDLDNFCQSSMCCFDPPYRQVEGEPNRRVGTIVNWLYLPNYAMNQDEDLVIDAGSLLRELRLLANEKNRPLSVAGHDGSVKKEGWVLEIYSHQHRDAFVGTMIQLADKPWDYVFPTIVSTFGNALRSVDQTQRAIQKSRNEMQQRRMTLEQQGEENPCSSSSSSSCSSPISGSGANAKFASTLIKILARADPSRGLGRTRHHHHHQLRRQQHQQQKQQQREPPSATASAATTEQRRGDDSDDATSADVSRHQPQELQQQQQEQCTSNAISVINSGDDEAESPREAAPDTASALDDDDDGDTVTSTSTNTTTNTTTAVGAGVVDSSSSQQQSQSQSQTQAAILSKEDAAEIVCCLTRCGPPSDFAKVVRLAQEYDVIPPGSKTGDKVGCYDFVLAQCHLPVVVYKNPKLGFHYRSSTLVEDWCVIQ